MAEGGDGANMNVANEQNGPVEGFAAAIPANLLHDIDKSGEVPIFNIRDGVPGNLGPLIIRPSVADAYKWVPITGVTAENAARHIGLFIRSARLNFERHAPEGWDAPRKLNAAVLLGTARAVTTWVYKLTDADLIDGEKLPAILMLQPDGTVRIADNLPAGVAAMAAAALELSDTQKALVHSVIEYAAGILPLQGFCLINTQHHYLSDGNGTCRKAFKTVEQQFWKSPATKAFYTTDTEIWQDILWHKACHPVQIALKRNMAIREDTKGILIKMGVGSAAARLPALEAELRAAITWLTVMRTVSVYFSAYGGGVDYSYLEWAVEFAKATPATGGAVPNDFPTQITAKILVGEQVRVYVRPTSVNDRPKAVEWVTGIMDRNTQIAAFCYGFYSALSENVQNSLGEGFVDTLKGSYSLGKLRSQSMAAFAQGVEAHKDYLAFKARQRAAGNYLALKLVLEV